MSSSPDSAPISTIPQQTSSSLVRYRKKRSHVKVHSGCITCKGRHVKCDESKPTCLQCKRVGRACQGYPDQYQNVKIIVPSNGTPEELRGTQYYYEKTVATICGLFEAQFWRNIVLQASTSEPAVKHALIALASINEAIDKKGGLAQKRIAWQQCNNAIQILTSRKNISQSVLLVASSLFMYLEILQDRIPRAMAHLRSAYQLLAIPGSDICDKDVLNFYNDMYFELGIVVSPQTRATNFGIKLVNLGPLPEILSTPDQVKHALFKIIQSRRVPETRQELEQIIREQRRMLTNWTKRIDTSTLTPMSQVATWTCKAIGLVCLSVFHCFYAQEECVTDQYLPEFALALEACEAIYKVEDTTRRSGKSSSWSSYRSLHPVLSCLVLHCRDPVIRRKALNLMRKFFMAQQDNSAIALEVDSSADSCELIIKAEESRCNGPVLKASDVPESARVRMSSSYDLVNPSGSWVRWVRYPYIDNGPYEEAWIPRTLVNDFDDNIEDETDPLGCTSSVAALARFNNVLKIAIWKIGLINPTLNTFELMIAATTWCATNFSDPSSPLIPPSPFPQR